jgi:RNA polymerase sigma-70 factor (ECF subfamily)
MRRYAAQLRGIAFALLGDWDLALDVSQEAFVALWERRATVRDDRNIPGYLMRMVRNRALDVRKHEHRRHRTIEAAVQRDLDRPASAMNDAERALDTADVTRQLWQAVQAIPESPRRVFLLNWHARLTYPEIAELLGVKLATVHRLMFRATSRLAEVYQNARRDMI